MSSNNLPKIQPQEMIGDTNQNNPDSSREMPIDSHHQQNKIRKQPKKWQRCCMWVIIPPLSLVLLWFLVSEICTDWVPRLLLADKGQIVFVATDSFDKNTIYVANANGSGLTKLFDNGNKIKKISWSPDGKTILFNSDDQIFTIGADGSNLVQLTNVGKNSDPDMSPRGDKIVFVSERDNETEIYIMNTDGSQQTPLAHGDSPRWSPDGERIAYSDFGILLINRDGTDKITLPVNMAVDDIIWSPNGMQLAFVADKQIYMIDRVDRDGSSIRQLPSKQYEFHSNPAWSPDSKKIVFESKEYVGHRTPMEIDIKTVDIDALQETRTISTGFYFF